MSDKKQLNEEDLKNVDGGGGIYNCPPVDGGNVTDNIRIRGTADNQNGGGAIHNVDSDVE